jgi:hypothetical protein
LNRHLFASHHELIAEVKKIKMNVSFVPQMHLSRMNPQS